MNISRAGAEEKLIKVGRMTREQIQKTHPARLAEIFVTEVKRNYSKFFPIEPNMNRLKSTAKLLFQSGGYCTFAEAPEREEDLPGMTLTLAYAEKKLVEQGAVTKEKIEKMSKSPFSGYGRSKVWMTKIFLKEVKKDYSVFFGFEPDTRHLKATATKLFRYGGEQKIKIKRKPKKSEDSKQKAK